VNNVLFLSHLIRRTVEYHLQSLKFSGHYVFETLVQDEARYMTLWMLLKCTANHTEVHCYEPARFVGQTWLIQNTPCGFAILLNTSTRVLKVLFQVHFEISVLVNVQLGRLYCWGVPQLTVDVSCLSCELSVVDTFQHGSNRKQYVCINRCYNKLKT